MRQLIAITNVSQQKQRRFNILVVNLFYCEKTFGGYYEFNFKLWCVIMCRSFMMLIWCHDENFFK